LYVNHQLIENSENQNLMMSSLSSILALERQEDSLMPMEECFFDCHEAVVPAYEEAMQLNMELDQEDLGCN
jgi:hypothetical protein